MSRKSKVLIIVLLLLISTTGFAMSLSMGVRNTMRTVITQLVGNYLTIGGNYLTIGGNRLTF